MIALQKRGGVKWTKVKFGKRLKNDSTNNKLSSVDRKGAKS